jgi:hypothetical protein
MNTVRIYRLTHLSPTLFGRLKAAQMEGAQVWNCCCDKEGASARRKLCRLNGGSEAFLALALVKHAYRTSI